MSSSYEGDKKIYKGVRRRKWGKWVSEIRVPGTQERLWLGSYSTPEAAAVARDIAYYCLRKPTSSKNLNFPVLPANVRTDMSPRSIQKAASDAGMAIDAQLGINHLNAPTSVSDGVVYYGGGTGDEIWPDHSGNGNGSWGGSEGENLNVSVEDYL